MPPREKRMSPRFALKLPAKFRNRETEIVAETLTIGRHGVFLATNHLRLAGELIQVMVRIPPEVADPPATLKMMAVVAWSLTAAEAEQHQQRPGMGLKFFMVGAADKAIWDSLIDNLEAMRARSEAEGERPLNAPSPPPVPLPHASSLDGPVRFLVRARSVDQLRAFAGQELRKGSMFLRTPLMRTLHEIVSLVLIHPQTEGEFALPGRVKGMQGVGPIAARGMDIEFLDADSELHSRFEHFVLEGRAPDSSAPALGLAM